MYPEFKVNPVSSAAFGAMKTRNNGMSSLGDDDDAIITPERRVGGHFKM